MIKIIKTKKIFIIFILFIFLFGSFHNLSYAKSEELQKNIESHTEKIKKLDEEIKTYQKQIEVVGEQTQTLKNAVKTLDINQKKIKTEINKTQINVEKTNLTIENLNDQIKNLEDRIHSNQKAVAKILNDMQKQDDITLIENILTNKSLAEVFDKYRSMGEFQSKVREKTKELINIKKETNDKKNNKEEEKQRLVNLKSELTDKNKILEINKKEKSTLLIATKNKETEYKKILAERQAEKERFERELFQFESQLKINIDPKSYPRSGKGILSWPLDNVFITQYFGKTLDAKRLYTSGTHNGVDFRASRGTPVKAALSGIIEGIGNTDEQKGCYSYGKWVLIKHPNGLSSLYAHLDLIKASSGQSVKTGDIIGYSGQTGYSTGPHLHFTLYASQGVSIQKYSSSRNCKNVSLPVSDVKAYLDPMLYF